jgi:hypothetical protein
VDVRLIAYNENADNSHTMHGVTRVTWVRLPTISLLPEWRDFEVIPAPCPRVHSSRTLAVPSMAAMAVRGTALTSLA